MNLDDRHARFWALHEREQLFVLPNPWDTGSARLMAGLGFEALATSSWAAAMAAGRMDGAGAVTRDVALAHSEDLVAATDLPVSADLEDGFGSDPDTVFETVRQATTIGLSGASIEDTTGDPEQPIYDFERAVERIEAAVAGARSCGRPFVLTARAEGFSYGQPDLDEVIARLQAFEAVGADVFYAPELPSLDAVRTVCESLTKPVNAVAGLGLPPQVTLGQLESVGVRRVSLGSSPYRAAMRGLLAALPPALHDGDLSVLAAGSDFATVQDLILRGTPTA